MQTIHTLESKTYVAGGLVPVSLRDLPPGKRIKALILRLEATWTQPGSGQALVNGDDLCAVFQDIQIGKRTKGSGKYFDRLNWQMRGRQVNFPAQIPATASGVFRRTPTLVIPFYDENAENPMDGCPLTEFFAEDPINVTFAQAGTPGTPVVAGTLRTIAVLEDAEPGLIPSIVQMGYVDWSGQSILLEKGLYSHLFIYKDAVGSDLITSLEIASVSVQADGRNVQNLLRAEELGAILDYFRSAGSSYQAESATAETGGEQLTTEPDRAAAAAATVSMEYVPIFQPAPKYKMSQLLEVNNTLRIDCQGTMSSFRIGYRRIEPRSESQALKAAMKSGILAPNAADIRAKTGSKNALSPEKAHLLKYIPLRHDAASAAARLRR